MQTSVLINQENNIIDCRPVFNQFGYLPPGFHNINLDLMKYHFVDIFRYSNTRNIIFDGYIKFCTYLMSYYGIYNFVQWIGGSFCTTKNNPNDIDVVTFIDNYELLKISMLQYGFLQSPEHREMIKSLFYCDSINIFAPSYYIDNQFEEIKMHWRGVWGFDRFNTPKGSLRVTFGKGLHYNYI